MIVEEETPVNRTQRDSEEEDDSEEKRLETSLRMEANMLEERAKQDLLNAWRNKGIQSRGGEESGQI